MYVIFFNYSISMENSSKISPFLHYLQSIILVNMIKTNFFINMFRFCHLELFIIIHLKHKNLRSLKKLKLKALILNYMMHNKSFMKVEITQKSQCLLFLKKDYKRMGKDHFSCTAMEDLIFLKLHIFPLSK